MTAKYASFGTGSDTTGDGSILNPWKTAGKLHVNLSPGDIGYLRGGTEYTEYWSGSSYASSDGTALNPITFRNYPGESPVFRGIMTVFNNTPDYWIWQGITFRWPTGSTNGTRPNGTAYGPLTPGITTPMFQMWGGAHNRITECDFEGGQSKGFILFDEATGNVAPDDIQIDHCVFRNAPGSLTPGDTNQNHFIYISHGGATGVLIERNTFDTTLNGMWIKMGTQDGDTTSPPQNVTVRYNTCYNAANYGLTWSMDLTNALAEYNIFHTAGGAINTNYKLNAPGALTNITRNNLWYNAPLFLRGPVDGSTSDITNGGGNVEQNPEFQSTTYGTAKYLVPANEQLAYGRWAGLIELDAGTASSGTVASGRATATGRSAATGRIAR